MYCSVKKNQIVRHPIRAEDGFDYKLYRKQLYRDGIDGIKKRAERKNDIDRQLWNASLDAQAGTEFNDLDDVF